MGSTKTNSSLGTVEILHEGKEECKFSLDGEEYVRVNSTDMKVSCRRQHLAESSINVELHL